jgi:hypothetical protein
MVVVCWNWGQGDERNDQTGTINGPSDGHHPDTEQQQLDHRQSRISRRKQVTAETLFIRETYDVGNKDVSCFAPSRCTVSCNNGLNALKMTAVKAEWSVSALRRMRPRSLQHISRTLRQVAKRVSPSSTWVTTRRLKLIRWLAVMDFTLWHIQVIPGILTLFVLEWMNFLIINVWILN